MEVRDAGDGDIRAITEIYNDAVKNSTAIWNDATIDAANRLAWLSDRQKAGYPVLVAVNGAEGVLGSPPLAIGAPGMATVIRLNIRCMCMQTSVAKVSAKR
jgi:hypothetical protein